MNEIACVFLFRTAVECQGLEDDKRGDISVVHCLDGYASITEHFSFNFFRLVPVVNNFHMLN
ncbi:hypothetical protein D3C84_482900 [compost metagenome]